MVCKNCGNVFQNGMKFCPRCGSNASPEMPGGAPPVADCARRILRGPVFTIASVLAVVCLFLYLVSLFLPGMMERLIYVITSSGAYTSGTRELVSFLTALQGVKAVVVLFSLIGNLPVILEVIGLIVLMVHVRRGYGSTGLGLIKAGLVISIVYLAIMALVVVIFGIAAAAGLRYAANGAAVAMLIVLFIILAVVTVLSFCYFGALISIASSAEDALLRNIARKRPSLYAAVMNFILSAVAVIALLVSFGSGYFVLVSPVDVLSSLASVVMSVLFGVVIIQGRNMRMPIPVPPYYTNPAHGPAPAQGMTPPPAAAPAAAPTPVQPEGRLHYCAYCGRPLHGEEVCVCRQTPPQNEPPAAPAQPDSNKADAPANVSEAPASVPTQATASSVVDVPAHEVDSANTDEEKRSAEKTESTGAAADSGSVNV